MRRIFCVGRNYAAHAREMGKDPEREPPFFFSKPADTDSTERREGALSLDDPGSALRDRAGRGDRRGWQPTSPRRRALDHVYGYAVGIDLTRRDLQAEAKEMGRPLGRGQGLRRLGALHGGAPGGRDRPPGYGRRIWLKVGDEPRQSGDLSAS